MLKAMVTVLNIAKAGFICLSSTKVYSETKASLQVISNVPHELFAMSSEIRLIHKLMVKNPANTSPIDSRSVFAVWNHLQINFTTPH
jgi:hypothetical protein